MALSSKTKVGILTIAALIALGIIIIWKTDFLMMSRGYKMVGSFNNIEGLTIGSEVRYRGLKIGKVTKLDPGPFDIIVDAQIDRSIHFSADSKLRVSYDGIVGLKFLEITPGTSEIVYQPEQIIYGVRTSGIVDFIDIGAQNLQESKKILESIRRMVDDPKLRAAIAETIYAANKVAISLEQLTEELRETNQGISAVVNDPKFQASLKGTIAQTDRTLTSANNFFDSVGRLNIRPTGGVNIGSRSNSVMGNLDVVQNDRNYLRLGLGEGPSRQLSLLDVLFTAQLSDWTGYRIGVINNQLGGGLAYYPSYKTTWRGDVYDINNETTSGGSIVRLSPKVRLGYEYSLEDYLNLNLTADDLLNEGNRNFSIGILVKPPGSRIY